MAANDSKLTQARLKELLHYNPDTGVFTWLCRRGVAMPGSVAGNSRAGGRITIYLDNAPHEASKLAWLYVHGNIPLKNLRRKNKIPSDNRIDNFFDPCAPIPKVIHDPLNADRLRTVVFYDAETGVFTRRIVTGKTGKVGDIIGHTNKANRVEASIDGKIYLAHRLAWLYVTGKWPLQEIDHIDGNPTNNRISNLRDISRVWNAQNQRKARADNMTGVLGVSKHHRKWQANITVDGKIIFLGSFPSEKLAGEAYVNAKRVLHDGCTI